MKKLTVYKIEKEVIGIQDSVNHWDHPFKKTEFYDENGFENRAFLKSKDISIKQVLEIEAFKTPIVRFYNNLNDEVEYKAFHPESEKVIKDLIEIDVREKLEEVYKEELLSYEKKLKQKNEKLKKIENLSFVRRFMFMINKKNLWGE